MVALDALALVGLVMLVGALGSRDCGLVLLLFASSLVIALIGSVFVIPAALLSVYAGFAFIGTLNRGGPVPYRMVKVSAILTSCIIAASTLLFSAWTESVIGINEGMAELGLMRIYSAEKDVHETRGRFARLEDLSMPTFAAGSNAVLAGSFSGYIFRVSLSATGDSFTAVAEPVRGGTMVSHFAFYYISNWLLTNTPPPTGRHRFHIDVSGKMRRI